MRKILYSILAIALLAVLIYFSGIGFYAEKFSANSKFGIVDVSNLTLEQAQAKLVENYNSTDFVIKEGGKEVATLTVGDLNPVYQTHNQLEASYLSQDPSLWIREFFQTNQYPTELDGTIKLDEEKILEELESQGLSNEDRTQAVDARIDYNESEGYHILEGEPGTQIDAAEIEAAIIAGLENNLNTIQLEDAYIKPQITQDSEEVQEILEMIKKVSSVEITYEISGDEITIPQDKIEAWIYFDEANNVIIDGESVRGYLEELNEEYSTFNDVRRFESTYQGIVEVPPGILGWGIDIDSEIPELIDNIHSGEDVQRAPEMYSTGGLPGAENEIGDTYIEIDLTYQAMLLYVDGELIIETPIVSGKIGAETVPGANAVNEMLKETKLVGRNQFLEVDYSVPVEYWIRFDDKDQGIHDASWQWSYGGDIYLYGGSLGCINTPLDAVEIIYQYVDYGTPVIVFN